MNTKVKTEWMNNKTVTSWHDSQTDQLLVVVEHVIKEEMPTAFIWGC